MKPPISSYPIHCLFTLILAICLIMGLTIPVQAGESPSQTASSWTSADINSDTSGTTTESGFQNTISGSGSRIGSTKDSFRLVYDTLGGDLALETKISAWNSAGSNSARGGLMLRSSTQPASAFVMIGLAGKQGIRFLWRTADGNKAVEVQGPSFATLPVWLKLQKTGTNYKGSYSADGVHWTLVGSAVTTSLSSPYLAGLAIASGKAGTFASLTSDSLIGPAPAINIFAPGRGVVGSEVIVSGEHLTGASQVKMGGISTNYQVISPYELHLSVPDGQDAPITITVPGGIATSQATFDIQWPPQITGFTPGSGLVGSVVGLNGQNFIRGAISGVTFNGLSAIYEVDSDTHLTAVVPAGATSGPITVTAADGSATSTNSFTVILPSLMPVLTSSQPSSGMAGTMVQITGRNLSFVNEVLFNGVPSTNILHVSDTLIRATVPAEATTGPITIRSDYGSATGMTFIVLRWTSMDIGISSGLIGSTYLGDDFIAASAYGQGFQGTSDSFRYIYGSVNDFARSGLSLSAELGKFSGGPNSQAGIMIRTSTSPDAAFAALYVDGSGQMVFRWRSAPGQECSTRTANLPQVTGPIYLSLLSLDGQSVSAGYSYDGNVYRMEWTSTPFASQDPLYYGLAISGGTEANIANATYLSIRANPPMFGPAGAAE